MGRKKRLKRRITASTPVTVEERGRIVTKPLGDCLPPSKWFEKMRGEVKPDAKDVGSVIADIWWKLPPKRKLEIMRRTKKFKGFA